MTLPQPARPYCTNDPNCPITPDPFSDMIGIEPSKTPLTVRMPQLSTAREKPKGKAFSIQRAEREDKGECKNETIRYARVNNPKINSGRLLE